MIGTSSLTGSPSAEGACGPAVCRSTTRSPVLLLIIAGAHLGHCWSALLIAVPLALSGALLSRGGIETRGHRLEDIPDALSG